MSDKLCRVIFGSLLFTLGGLGFAATMSAPDVISVVGSGRATAYSEQNKIITIGDRTHVVWLDAGTEGFRVRGRTLNRTTGEWSPIVTIGEAQDNHGDPGLTVDSHGYLHILYYPHHGQFRYRQTLRPNDMSEWSPEIRFGEELSYPTLICSPDDTLILSARRGYHDTEGKHIEDTRMEQELWKKPAGGVWQRQALLLRSRQPGYAQFALAMVWGPDHKTIHLSCRIYEGPPFGGGEQSFTMGYMVSDDEGVTWKRSDGSLIKLPATADTVDVLAKSDGVIGPRLNGGPLGVDAAGIPYLTYTANVPGASRWYLASPAPGLGWTRRDLTGYLPDALSGWDVNLGMGGGLSFSESGRATLVATVITLPMEGRTHLKEWGHPMTEVVRLWSDDGMKSFQSEVLAPVHATQAHWLPNIERPTGHNPVPDYPGIVYTAGAPGGGLDDLELNNQVWFWWRDGK